MYKLIFCLGSIVLVSNAKCNAQKTPQLVSPGLITNNNEYSTTLSPDGKTMYFVRQINDVDGSLILKTEKVNDKWSTPEKVSFTGVFSDTDPMLTPDGKTMYFMTNRNAHQDGSKDDYDIWATNLIEGQWGKPYRLPDFINTSFTEGFPCITSDGSMFFFRFNSNNSDQDIWYSEKIGGGFDTPHKLRGEINTEKWDGHPFVDANKEYMIFYSSKREGGYGSCDLYISFYTDGNWGKPKNLGDVINKDTCEMVPFVTRDGNTLYFSRIEKDGGRNIYQIDFSQIKEGIKE
ncbi:hypothetical protein WIW50_11645 [Flavobacteriaceae bacterium 3-367]